jgi:hypothetical protein
VRTINILLHDANEETKSREIKKITLDTYRKAVMKLLDKSDLTLTQKKELLNRIINEGNVKSSRD